MFETKFKYYINECFVTKNKQIGKITWNPIIVTLTKKLIFIKYLT